MKLILGLGNPGWKYKGTRHNIGFRAVDALSGGLTEVDGRWQSLPQLKSKCFEGKLRGKPVVLAKPLTFMNHSGVAAELLLKHYRLPAESLIVVHDDKDISLGKIKVQRNRGHGGHNGVRSIINQLQTTDFFRVRIGVASLDGTGMEDTVRFVLQRFKLGEMRSARTAVDRASAHTIELI